MPPAPWPATLPVTVSVPRAPRTPTRDHLQKDRNGCQRLLLCLHGRQQAAHLRRLGVAHVLQQADACGVQPQLPPARVQWPGRRARMSGFGKGGWGGQATRVPAGEAAAKRSPSHHPRTEGGALAPHSASPSRRAPGSPPHSQLARERAGLVAPKHEDAGRAIRRAHHCLREGPQARRRGRAADRPGHVLCGRAGGGGRRPGGCGRS
jgi:hypothetical protein